MTTRFITLEGIDGCGKTTHGRLLAEALRARGFEVELTREPGGTPAGERMRELLLSKQSAPLGPRAELLLMAADRAQHVEEVIRPALQAGRTVICDRYTDSTVAFQGYGRSLDLQFIEEVNRFATGGLMPGLTILFDLDPAQARQRLNARPAHATVEEEANRLDDEEAAFHQRVYAGYQALLAMYPERVRAIDTSGSIEETHRRVMELVESVLPRP